MELLGAAALEMVMAVFNINLYMNYQTFIRSCEIVGRMEFCILQNDFLDHNNTSFLLPT